MVWLATDLVQNGNETLAGNGIKGLLCWLKVNNVELDACGTSGAHRCRVLDACNERA